MFLVEFICHQKCTSWRKLHFSACCTNDIFVDILQNMVNIYYFGCAVSQVKAQRKISFAAFETKIIAKQENARDRWQLPVSEHNFPTCWTEQKHKKIRKHLKI